MSPRYDAIEVARYLAKENNIPLILGSATPDMKSYYKAKNGEIELLTLTKRANNSNLPAVKVVDLRQELANGNKSMLSDLLKEEIEKNLITKLKLFYFK